MAHRDLFQQPSIKFLCEFIGQTGTFRVVTAIFGLWGRLRLRAFWAEWTQAVWLDHGKESGNRRRSKCG